MHHIWVQVILFLYEFLCVFFHVEFHFHFVPDVPAVLCTNTQSADLTAWSFTADEGAADEAPQVDAAAPQTLHYTLNQQVQFHRIGEDGQVQVVSGRLENGCVMITEYQCVNFLFSGHSRYCSQKSHSPPKSFSS